MTRIVPRRYVEGFGPIVGGVLSVTGAIGVVVALATTHLGVILYTGTRVFASRQEYVYHATADASLAYFVLFLAGSLLAMIAAGLWTIGIRLLERHADRILVERDSVGRNVLTAGEIVAIFGPSVAGVAVILGIGLEWLIQSLLFAFVVYCIGLALIVRAVRPAIHLDRSPASGTVTRPDR